MAPFFSKPLSCELERDVYACASSQVSAAGQAPACAKRMGRADSDIGIGCDEGLSAIISTFSSSDDESPLELRFMPFILGAGGCWEAPIFSSRGSGSCDMPNQLSALIHIVPKPTPQKVRRDNAAFSRPTSAAELWSPPPHCPCSLLYNGSRRRHIVSGVSPVQSNESFSAIAFQRATPAASPSSASAPIRSAM